MIIEGVEINAIRNGVDIDPLYGAGDWLSPGDVVWDRAGKKKAVTSDHAVQRFLASEALGGGERITVVFDRTREPGPTNPRTTNRPGLTGAALLVKEVLADAQHSF